MISALFKGLLNFILKLFELIMSPFVSAITALFPDVRHCIFLYQYFSYLCFNLCISYY